MENHHENQIQQLVTNIYELIIASYSARSGVVEIAFKTYPVMNRELSIEAPNLFSTPIRISSDKFKDILSNESYITPFTHEGRIVRTFREKVFEILNKTGFGSVKLIFKNTNIVLEKTTSYAEKYTF